jgi:hypothetical protein
MRELPPTRSTASTALGARPADRSAWRSAVVVAASGARTMSSNSERVRRTSPRPSPTNGTGTATAVSDDRVSLASTQSARSRASATGATADTSRPSAATTCPNTASSKSMPPSRSTPWGSPRISQAVAVLRSTATSNVPPPRSYTATTDPGATRCWAA